jgi:4-amino-4-deoxy-L-arabinose transferase-like glycosyltransferase
LPGESIRRYAVWLVFVLATIAYLFGLFVNVMDVDAAQYASISREMMENHQYLQVLHREQNYLDKPPLLFWLSSLSFHVFGVSNFSYKLPTFLFSLLGVFSVYKIGSLLYNKNAGILSALLLYTCQAYFLSNNDVRTDGLLAANVTFACWQLLEFTERGKLRNLLLGFTGVALAMMAKGPIGAIVPAAAVFSHLAYRREWRKMFSWKWFAGMAFALLLMIPMLYGLYGQYGIDGPKFFFWTQSFGRITGENIWHNDAGYFYFLHNFLWSFLPWSLLASFAVVFRVYELLMNRFRSTAVKEIFSSGGFLLPFIALSFSHYKLPHYIFVVYPLCAVVTAGFITEKISSDPRMFRVASYVQLFIALGIVGGAVYLSAVIFPLTAIWPWLIIFMLICLLLYFFFRAENLLTRLIMPAAIGIIAVDLLLNGHIYPTLLKYQAGSELATIARDEQVPKDKLFFYRSYSHSFEFYYREIVPAITADNIISDAAAGNDVWIIGNEELLAFLNQHDIQPKRMIAVNDFSVSLLTITFLDPKTRSQAVRKRYLVEL